MPSRRHAAGGQDRADRAHSLGRRTLVAGADREIDHNSAGTFVPPGLRERQHFRALHGIEFAAIGADEDLKRVVGFRDRDRVTLTVVDWDIGNGGHLLIGVAST